MGTVRLDFVEEERNKARKTLVYSQVNGLNPHAVYDSGTES